MLAAGILLGISSVTGQPFWLVMIWLCLTGSAAYQWPPPFWALPTVTLTASAAAVSIGLINIFANLAGYLGNYLLGWMRQNGANDGQCLVFLGSCYGLGAFIVSFVRTKRPVQATEAALITL